MEASLPFSESFVFVYRETWTFLKRAWWIAALVVIPEVVALIPQMDSIFVSKYADIASIGWSTITYCLSSVVFYVFSRFVILDHDLRQALHYDSRTLRTYLPFASIFVMMGVLYDVVWTSAWRFAAALGYLVTLSLTALWAVSAPGGGNIVTPAESIRRGFFKLPWALTFAILSSLPFIILAMIFEPPDYDRDNASLAEWMHYGSALLMACSEQIVTYAIVHAFARHLGLKTEIQRLSSSRA